MKTPKYNKEVQRVQKRTQNLLKVMQIAQKDITKTKNELSFFPGVGCLLPKSLNAYWRHACLHLKALLHSTFMKCQMGEITRHYLLKPCLKHTADIPRVCDYFTCICGLTLEVTELSIF